MLLGGRLLREGVLQQSALSANDAFCSAGKAAALVDLVLDVVARLRGPGRPRACPRPRVEEFDFTPVLRAREDVGPEDAAGRGGASGTSSLRLGSWRELAVTRRSSTSACRSCAGRCWWSAAWPASAGTSSPRSGWPPARRGTGWCSRSTATSPSSRCSRAPTGIEPAGTRVSFAGRAAADPGRRGLAGPGVQRPRRAARRRPAGVRRARPRRSTALPLNPTWRLPPAEPVLTGISAIDALTTLVRGPEAAGVLAWPGCRTSSWPRRSPRRPSAGGEPFCVVFAAMGLTHADAAAVRDTLEERSAAGELVLLLNTADDPVIERVLTPRLALTVAEHLAFGTGRHVLVVMADMTSYAEALREVSAARGEIPARRAYPGYLYSDLASLYERCGRIRGPARVGDRAAGAHHAGRRHHPPGARPHRLHHRGADRAVGRGARARRLPAGRPALLAVAADAQRAPGRAAPATTTSTSPPSCWPRWPAPGRPGSSPSWWARRR